MSRLSHNLATKAVPILELEFQKKNTGSEIARKALNDNLAPTKTWAADLSVTAKAVSQWSSGERSIPPLRVGQILRQAKAYCMQVDALESHIDRWLLMNYGPVGQNMIDRGGADY